MDGLEERNIWESPSEEKGDPSNTILPTTSTSTSEAFTDDTFAASSATIETKDEDADAWGAGSDEDHNSQEFVEAVSTLDLNRSSVTETTVEDDASKDDWPEAGPSTSKPFTFQPPAVGFSSSASEPSGGQFDDFPADDEDDGFGDFGDTNNAGGDDDDFGDFDEAGFQSGAVDFEATEPPPTSSTPANIGQDPDFPNVDYPDLTGIEAPVTADKIRPIFKKFFEQVYPDMYDYFAEPCPNQYESDPKDAILFDSASKAMWQKLVEDDLEYKPFEWKKSHIRVNMAKALGIPVNLDDMHDSSSMPSLVLPNIHTTPATPAKGASTKASSSTATKTLNPSSPTTTTAAKQSAHTSRPSSRSATPSHSMQPIPPFDISKCKELLALNEEEMSFKTLTELEMLRNDLLAVAVQASDHLTALLERKELLSGQNDTYNAMIQDLVMAAQKMRSTSSPAGGQSTSRKPSIKRSVSNTNKVPTSSTSSVSGGSKFWGGSGSSRPSSPSPAVTSKGLGQSSAAGKDPVRKSSGLR